MFNLDYIKSQLNSSLAALLFEETDRLVQHASAILTPRAKKVVHWVQRQLSPISAPARESSPPSSQDSFYSAMEISKMIVSDPLSRMSTPELIGSGTMSEFNSSIRVGDATEIGPQNVRCKSNDAPWKEVQESHKIDRISFEPTLTTFELPRPRRRLRMKDRRVAAPQLSTIPQRLPEDNQHGKLSASQRN